MLTREERNQRLDASGLSPTGKVLNDHCLWKTAQGHPIWVPDGDDEYPEPLVDKLLRAAGQLLYRDGF